MELTSSFLFDAPVENVWSLLMDAAAVARCLPGCKSLQPAGEDRYEVQLGIAISAISGDFKGTVALQDKVPPHAYRLVVEGTGRQGFVKGSSDVRLEAEGGKTRVHVSAQAEVGGMIARVGQRLLEGVARTTMDRFYACLGKQLAAGA